ncbi:GNAT family N-acetyltransferase [Paenibacillus sp. y28]|uniref:GNAT family N-acetyltransferase n=1 Tax=Paenibacillus sp. y28 TaxID=3129110 RepID=UPI0030173FB4
MYLRSFQLSDYAPITGLLSDVLSESCFRETMEAFGRQLSWDSELVLVAEEEGAVTGVIIGTIDRNNGYYYRIAVDKQHQRKGIGTAMVEGLRKRFEKRKVSKIMVTVDAHNEYILPLYESVGYQREQFTRAFQKLRIVSGA